MSLPLIYNYLKMKSLKIGILVLFTFSSLFFYPAKTSAEGLNLPKVSINPSYYLLYSFKRLFEKGDYYLKFSDQAKLDYFQHLVLTRMSELQNMVNANSQSDIEQATQRLSYQIGTLSDFLASHKSSLPNKQGEVINLLNNLKDPLANMRDKYHSNSSFWLLLQHNINTIDINLTKLK